jgi:probable O-glycosylation ligase (exosortase A-associated)
VKQLVFMIAMTGLGSLGVFVISPFWGVFVYYLYAILRPQFMWQWSLPAGVNWSLYVAVPTIIAAALGLNAGTYLEPKDRIESEHQHRLTGAHLAMLLFGLWIGVTYAMAQNREAASYWFEEYVKIFIMYFVAAAIVRTTKQVWVLYLMVGLVLAYVGYEVNFAYFSTGRLYIYHNGYGGLDNNGAGLMLATGVPICWFCFEGIQKRWRWAFVAFIPILVHAVLMTYSRGAMLALIVMVPLVLLRSRHRTGLIVALLVFAVLALPTLAGPEIRARFMTLQASEVDDSAKARKESWSAAWHIAKDYPLFGVGVRNANLFSHLYGADMEGRTIHSQYFQILADNGFPGLALYLVMLVTSWGALRRVRRLIGARQDSEGRRDRAMVDGIECAMAVYCFGAVFLSLEVFELPYFLLLLAAQLATVQREDPAACTPAVRPGRSLECGVPCSSIASQ